MVDWGLAAAGVYEEACALLSKQGGWSEVEGGPSRGRQYGRRIRKRQP